MEDLCLAAAVEGHHELQLTRTECTRYAVALVEKYEMTQEKAIELMGAAKSTVNDHILGKCGKYGRGRYRLLTDAQEQIVANELRKRRPRGTLEQLRRTTYRIAVTLQITPLINRNSHAVGKKWLSSFVRRHQIEI